MLKKLLRFRLVSRGVVVLFKTLHLLHIRRYYRFDDTYLVSFPKSGRTWLRVMLDRLNIKLNYTHDDSSLNGLHFRDLETNKSFYKGKKVIFLTRDPRDVVVSNYFHCTKRIGVYKGSISDFVMNEKCGIKKILQFQNIWFRNKSLPADFLLIRYEDLHKDTLGELRKILDFLGIRDIDEDKLKRAVWYGRFENMQKREAMGFFSRRYGKILTPADMKDKESFKVRKGKVGGYKDYLDEKDRKYCSEWIRKMGNPFY